MLGRERIFATLQGLKKDRLAFMPITMMFAGDLLGAPYRQYACDYQKMVEGQLLFAEKFDVDFVSTISDPAREACDCGANIRFFDDQPPAIDEANALLAEQAELLQLKMPDPLGGGRMTDRINAVALFAKTIKSEKLVEGWVEGPCAEGSDLRGINTLMLDFITAPKFVHDLFDFTTTLGLRFAKAQIDAGADIIGVGDAAASLVGPHVYEEFVWPYEKKLVDGIHAMGGLVRLHICGNTTSLLDQMGKLGCDIVDLDWMVSLARAREAMGPDQVLLGNLDPVAGLRNSTPQAIRAALAECHKQAGPRYIVSAGCEVPRDTPHENLRAMLEYAQGHQK